MCSNKKCMQGRQEISNPSLCHSAVEKKACWHNDTHAKYPWVWWCLWLHRPPADTCNPGQWKQTWNGGWMTDAHCLWHPCTQALKGDWQKFAYESGENELGACNDMCCSADQSMFIPHFSLPKGAEKKTFLSVSIITKGGERVAFCQIPFTG